ncbi:MAG: hypothetical protein LBJ14_05365 [Desulfarculales bacterium]|nr:hypothetical protein [Desulfarculales bacterium]
MAAPEEQALLVKYVGWGGIPQAFAPANMAWRNEHARLKALLTPEQFEQARRSTQDAHYTSETVIKGIYQGLEKLGFNGNAKILEPSEGIGNFLGLLPPSMPGCHFTSVELDPLTSAIAAYLYPEYRHINQGFQEILIPEKHFDLVVSNPPFGSQKIYDESKPELSHFSIHNYFLAKSIDSLREGGIGVFVVSRYFMDAVDDSARAYIAQKANLLGAFRLPGSAFKTNALTEVSTDIVFFQRADSPEIEPSWVKTGAIQDQETGKPITINQYYLEKPQQLLGRMAVTGRGLYRESVEMLSLSGTSIEEVIQNGLGSLPENVYQPYANKVEELRQNYGELFQHALKKVKVGAYILTPDKRIAKRIPDLLAEAQFQMAGIKNARAMERIQGMIVIRDVLADLMKMEQRENVSNFALDAQRSKLSQVYDKYAGKYGFINSMGNRLAMRDDPDYPLLCSLERNYDPGISKETSAISGFPPRKPSADKADIFRERVLGPKSAVAYVGTAKEALIVSMNEHGRPDLAYMGTICGQDADRIIRDLAGLIYHNPRTEQWEIADHYLTGNVRQKLQEAQMAAIDNPRYTLNIQSLLAVQPPDIDPVDISVQIGASWIPEEIINDFVTHILGDVDRVISYLPSIGRWSANIAPPLDVTLNRDTWGTQYCPSNTILEKVITNKPIKILLETGKDFSGKPIFTVDEQETVAANQKADEVRQAFQDWLWRDEQRRDRLAKLYNQQFNTHIPRKYDGSHLTLPGSSLAVSLRPHQKAAIWRGIQDGTALFDHVVGAGKTLACVGTIMESKRMGLLQKPMLVVPNHLLMQWQDAFYSLYPQANILVAAKDDFKKVNRERLFARVATGNWDAVIVAESSFGKIGMPEEKLAEILKEQIDDLSSAIEQLRKERSPKGRGHGNSIKQLEKTRERLNVAMQKRLTESKKDKVVTFAELGVDALFVDESQIFKNLFITTTQHVAGLGNLQGSAKAFDLYIKARYLQEKNNGRGLFFATGTPISNSIAELYTIQRYMQYRELKANGLLHFDSWASTFGQISNTWELDATGVNYKLASRFAKFQNVPELINIYRSFADVINQKDLNQQAEAEGKKFPVPKIKGGKALNIVAERSPDQAAYMEEIISRMENLPKDPRIDNPLKVTNDARKAGLDYRLINPEAPDFAGSKINLAAEQIYRIWQEWEQDKGTQLVFCDLSTPKNLKSKTAEAVTPLPEAAAGEVEQSARPYEFSDGYDPQRIGDMAMENEEPVISMDEILSAAGKFSVYDDLKQKLLAKGIPEQEIRFIHEADTEIKKAKLFKQVNRGEVRILMGSTAKMGAGTNVQERIVALHHLDAPWRPSDLEQRDGRGIRQGNLLYQRDPENFALEIIRYATKQTYDARMWQTIESKANGIEQFRRGDSLLRVIDDINSEAASAAEMKAAATGNHLIFTQVKLALELKNMEAVYRNYIRNQHLLENRVKYLEKAPQRYERAMQQWKAAINLRDRNTVEQFNFSVEGRSFSEKQKGEVSAHILRAMKQAAVNYHETPLGTYRGFDISVKAGQDFLNVGISGAGGHSFPATLMYGQKQEVNVSGFFQRIDNWMAKFASFIDDAKADHDKEIQELERIKPKMGESFPQMELLNALRQDNREVMAELKLMQKNSDYISGWQPQSIGKEEKQARVIKKELSMTK